MRSKRTDCGTSADLGNPGWNRGRIGHLCHAYTEGKGVCVAFFMDREQLAERFIEAASMPKGCGDGSICYHDHRKK